MTTSIKRNKNQLKSHKFKQSLNKTIIQIKSRSSIITKVVGNNKEIRIRKTQATITLRIAIKEAVTLRIIIIREANPLRIIIIIREAVTLIKEESLSTNTEVIYRFLISQSYLSHSELIIRVILVQLKARVIV
jgi:hypothetical protein